MLRLIALGHTNAEIAQQLFLSRAHGRDAPRAHPAEAARTTRAELVRYALEHGFVDVGHQHP